ncbi:MAG: glycosyltransferase family 4 protein [Prevotella sp.]|nr:glycosyltransferase family 4 protein [Prevotella sp.]
MKIAYLTNYLGLEFLTKYGKGKKFALSGPFKSRGIARSLMAAGHEVTVYSPAVTTCDAVIPAFTEVEEYPEGKLTIKYCNILSKRRCAPINEWRISRMLRKEAREYDALVYYNITLSAALSIGAFNHAIKVIEYEDNIFNRSLVDDKISMEGYKRKLYNYLMARTHGVMAVCLGLQLKETLKYSVLTPGIINEDVINNVSNRVNTITKDKPVHIILTGGIHYSKGGDLLVKTMTHIKTPCIVSVYGNCNLDEALKKLIADVPERHEFRFKGYMEHAELIKTLDKDADILINTTRSMGVGAQAAGFPFKMMEYASTGRPIVSSEIGKLDEEYNRHITYYDSEQPEAIAAAVEEVIAHYDEKVQLALDLQKKVLNEYTIEGTGKKLNSFFKEIEAHES